VVCDRFTPEQGPDDVGALAKPCVALCLLGPGQTGDVLVQALTAAEREPEATGKHLAQGRGGLRQDGRMIAVARGGDHAEGEARCLERRSQPRPREAGLPLRFAPWPEMVRGHRAVETRGLGELNKAQEV
jgi:hypothetical protein